MCRIVPYKEPKRFPSLGKGRFPKQIKNEKAQDPNVILLPGKKYPETWICKIHGKKSLRIANSPLVFPNIIFLPRTSTSTGIVP